MVFSHLHASLAVLSAAMGLASAQVSSHMIMGGLQPIAYERVDSIIDPGTVSTACTSPIKLNAAQICVEPC